MEQQYTLILSGHEHQGDDYSISRSTATATFLAGEVLSSVKSNSSSFYAILLEADFTSSRVSKFAWDGNQYTPDSPRALVGFRKNTVQNNQRCRLSIEHQRYLEDPEFALNHPDRDRLSLRDYFVYPHLRRLDSKDRPSLKLPPVTVNLEMLVKNGSSLLFGADTCGKTSLAKRLYCDALEKGYTPLLLRGGSISKCPGRLLTQLLRETFAAQYAHPDFQTWQMLPGSKRLLIIDDWHRTPLRNKEKRHQVLSILSAAFESMIVIAGEELQFEAFESGEHSLEAFGFRNFLILPFGHQRRSALIDKWISLCQIEDANDDELEHRRVLAEREINRIIGTNFVPSYPFYILLLLSQHEAQKPTNTTSGSYGHLYEALITFAIERVHDSTTTLDTKLNYLTEFAQFLRSEESRVVSTEKVQKWHEAHCNKYRLKLPFTTLIGELIEAGILTSSHDTLGFRHRFTRYYFVGRYLRDHLGEPDIRADIAHMAKRLHNTESANVLIFLCYLCKDPFILQTMLDSSRTLFAKHRPCEMGDDTHFLKNLLGYAPEIHVRLPTGSARQHREQLARARDESQPDPSGEDCDEDAPSNRYADDADDASELVQFSAALKTIRILGQVLRNFAGSITGEVKHDIAAECYSLGMRVLGFFMSAIRTNQEQMLGTISKAFVARSKSTAPATSDELDKQVRLFLFLLCSHLAYVLTKHVSHSVGLPDLRLTFDDILERNNVTSYTLIDLSIRLDSLSVFPKKLIESMHKKEEKNTYAHAVFVQLIANHFHLNQVNYRTRQHVCALVGIQSATPRVLSASDAANRSSKHQ